MERKSLKFLYVVLKNIASFMEKMVASELVQRRVKTSRVGKQLVRKKSSLQGMIRALVKKRERNITR
jgi:hypothetical protein